MRDYCHTVRLIKWIFKIKIKKEHKEVTFQGVTKITCLIAVQVAIYSTRRTKRLLDAAALTGIRTLHLLYLVYLATSQTYLTTQFVTPCPLMLSVPHLHPLHHNLHNMV